MKSSLLLEQVKKPEVQNCIPRLGESTRNQEILRRFSQGESCSALAKIYGVSGWRINEVLFHIVKKANTFLRFVALCEDQAYTEVLIQSAPDLCSTDRDILLRLQQEKSIPVVADALGYRTLYVYVVLNRFFKVTAEGYESLSEYQKKTSEKLISLRRAAGLSIPEAAEKARISVKQLIHYESGRSRQYTLILMKLAKAYSVTLDAVSG